MIGQREVAKHHNSWVVEKREYFEQRSLRDERRGKGEISREHPELASALSNLRLAELFASKNISTDPDRTRFVKLVRDATAPAIEHEMPVPAPKMREMRARTHRLHARRAKAGAAILHHDSNRPVIKVR